ncbi:MAG: zinc-binding dehydrogenase, partial [Balneolaceae bacterium]|nr:zinc-binding dehydrogenase [Balneolaceae bacterium]
MKAHIITSHGEPFEVFEIIDLDTPRIRNDEVLVKVHYTSVNPVDCRIRKNAESNRDFPLVLGFDLYGEVVDTGTAMDDLTPGDHVIASPTPFAAGANAEYIAVKAQACLKVEGLDPVIGAAIPLVGITAYESLFDRLQIIKDQVVLIHAGAGVVGHLAIQLAKNAGCSVITTASREQSIDLCRRLGADHVINYKNESVSTAVEQITNGRGVSCILDTVGGETFLESLGCLRPCGHICTILPAGIDDRSANANLLRNITVSYEFMGAS